MQHHFLLQTLLILLVAIISVAILKRARLPLVLGYLLTGVIVGPWGLEWLAADVMHDVGELGIVLLMFSLGLEFSAARLWAMRNWVFGLGFLQVCIGVGVASMLSYLWLNNWPQSIIIGCVVTLSSTAIVLRTFYEKGIMGQRFSQLSVSILLFQDLAVLPMLILIPSFSSPELLIDLPTLFYELFIHLMLIVGLFFIGRWLLPKLFDEVARAKTHELFVMSTLVVALLTGAITQSLGLSMALGAFIAGMLLGESEYKTQLEADIRPFRDVLMGLFFIDIGGALNLLTIKNNFDIILLLFAAISLFKISLVTVLGVLFKERINTALASGISLFQMGEFSFVLISLAVSYQLFDINLGSTLVCVAILSIAFTPMLVDIAQKIAGFTRRAGPVQNYQEQPVDVVILGFGRVGQTIARFLKNKSISYCAVESDPYRVKEVRAIGEPILYGNADSRGVLKKAQIKGAKLVVITYAEEAQLLHQVDIIRSINQQVDIAVRTRDDNLTERLKRAGVSLVIPEHLEGSLMMVSQVLSQFGVDSSEIMTMMREERRAQYPHLHDFFMGNHADPTVMYLHAVTLTDSAYAVGLTVEQLPLHKLKVMLKQVIRDDEVIPFSNVNYLCAGDVLIFSGSMHRNEAAENWCLAG